ncbi:hypothetical protein, partial [Thiobacillus sp. 63-78]|uniref:hypothetical protein n=1 Tax=Thiobacillus sp. 63-78 TaxID=1895859 RepID=UPI0025E62B4E
HVSMIPIHPPSGSTHFGFTPLPSGSCVIGQGWRFAMSADWRRVKPSNTLLDERGNQVREHLAPLTAIALQENTIMADANSTDLPTPEKFAVRLEEALVHWQRLNQRSLSALEKIQFIAKTAGRTNRTARAWLDGDHLPHRNQDIHKLAEALGASYVWLHFGIGHSPLSSFLMEKLATFPPEYVPKLTRYFLRLLNNDPKALRWAKMLDQGEIGMEQILAMA